MNTKSVFWVLVMLATILSACQTAQPPATEAVVVVEQPTKQIEPLSPAIESSIIGTWHENSVVCNNPSSYTSTWTHTFTFYPSGKVEVNGISTSSGKTTETSGYWKVEDNKAYISLNDGNATINLTIDDNRMWGEFYNQAGTTCTQELVKEQTYDKH